MIAIQGYVIIWIMSSWYHTLTLSLMWTVLYNAVLNNNNKKKDFRKRIDFKAISNMPFSF